MNSEKLTTNGAGTPEWKWYWGFDNETYIGGPCTTREHAIEEGSDHYGADGFCIVEANKKDVQLSEKFDVYRWLEDVDDDLYELADPDGGGLLCDLTKDQVSDLRTAITATISAWQKRHSIVITPWAFTDQRNEEYIKNE